MVHRPSISATDTNVSCQKNTHCKVDRRSCPGGVHQSCVLSIRDFLTLGPPLIIKPKQGSNKLADAQPVADQSDMNILLLFLHDIPNDGNYEFLDRPPDTIPKIVKTLSFGEFRLSSIKDGE